MSIRAYPPLPIVKDWAPSYLAGRGTQNRDFAFKVPDREGARARDGGRYHAAVDWFAPGGRPVRSPVPGIVHELERSSVTTGQVFGGTLRIRDASRRIWVLRHVTPARLEVGDHVDAGQDIANVTKWRSGSPHLHLEIWKTAAGGYCLDNMLDPATIEWGEPAIYFFEEMPDAKEQLGDHFRFGPWLSPDDRDRAMRARQENTGRRMRPFAGTRNSLYPWEDQ